MGTDSLRFTSAVDPHVLLPVQRHQTEGLRDQVVHGVPDAGRDDEIARRRKLQERDRRCRVFR